MSQTELPHKSDLHLYLYIFPSFCVWRNRGYLRNWGHLEPKLCALGVSSLLRASLNTPPSTKPPLLQGFLYFKHLPGISEKRERGRKKETEPGKYYSSTDIFWDDDKVAVFFFHSTEWQFVSPVMHICKRHIWNDSFTQTVYCSISALTEINCINLVILLEITFMKF